MDPNRLRDQLAKLHEELGKRRVDPRSNRLLGEILQDIKRLLDQQPTNEAPPTKPTASAPAPGAASLAERLEKIAVQFEADHPTLAQSARRLIDLLGKVGV